MELLLISSHILSEMELLADTVGILKEGKLLIEIPMEDIHEINLEYIVIKSMIQQSWIFIGRETRSS